LPPDRPDFCTHIRIAGRPLSSIPPEERYRYHVSKVIYYTGSDERPVAVTGDYALIGLHIIHKTRNYPTFVFATFEQVDVLDDEATGRPTGAYYIPTYDEIEYSLADIPQPVLPPERCMRTRGCGAFRSTARGDIPTGGRSGRRWVP
jgi:hypothetical protein